MAPKDTFRRYELKYLLDTEQAARIKQHIERYMDVDQYGFTTIRNIYFDTASYRLIRHSIEKPVYKEKLRLRSYCQATPDSDIFVELKKKYQGIVYKRRLSMPESQAICWLAGDEAGSPCCQIGEEIEYFRNYYGNLQPVLFLSYRRQAWYCLDGSDFRVTFDDNILCRQTDISLAADIGGTSILPDNKVLMEIKTAGAIPLWMTELLTGERIYKTSFSKYGTAYQTLIFPTLKGVFCNE